MAGEVLCAVSGCDRVAHSRGWCGSHYARWRAHGDPGPAEFASRAPSQRPCRELGCVAPVGSSGAQGWCTKHYQRWQTHGDPHALGYRGNGLSGPDHPAWTGDRVRYGAAHERVGRQRGLARNHACVHCAGPAADWAYTWDAPDELTNDDGRHYSPSPAYYQPMCKSCHKVYDLAHRRGVTRCG